MGRFAHGAYADVTVAKHVLIICKRKQSPPGRVLCVSLVVVVVVMVVVMVVAASPIRRPRHVKSLKVLSINSRVLRSAAPLANAWACGNKHRQGQFRSANFSLLWLFLNLI